MSKWEMPRLFRVLFHFQIDLPECLAVVRNKGNRNDEKQCDTLLLRETVDRLLQRGLKPLLRPHLALEAEMMVKSELTRPHDGCVGAGDLGLIRVAASDEGDGVPVRTETRCVPRRSASGMRRRAIAMRRTSAAMYKGMLANTDQRHRDATVAGPVPGGTLFHSLTLEPVVVFEYCG